MKKYDNFDVIVFDLGNTILPLSVESTIKAFQKLGLDGNILSLPKEQNAILETYQKGLISSEEFLSQIKEILPKPTTSEDIVWAWNTMLLEFPKAHLVLLEKLHKTHKTILLSNTNEIHEVHFKALAKKQGYELEELFHSVYYSHNIYMSKPSIEIYQLLHNEHHLENKKVLFLDDLQENIDTAITLGWQGYLVTKEKGILDLM